MKHILSRAGARTLAEFACSRVLLAFDFDGTLAPIVAKRDDARMRPATSALFQQVCELYPCAVISGRSRADVARRTNGAAVGHVLGNHGAEPNARMQEFERRIQKARALLEEALSDIAGIDIEDKRFSLAVHYRRARSKRPARAGIYAAVAELGAGFRTVPGKLVVNVVPGGAPHKGNALLALRRRERAKTAIYVGDDATDEDVFALKQPDRLLSIRVGRSTRSSADYYLRDQREMDALLRRLVALRREAARSRESR